MFADQGGSAMRAYSMDLRVRVLADCDAGMSTKVVAQKYTVSVAWVRRLKQRRRASGEVGPRVSKTGPKPKLLGKEERLEQLVAKEPDATLEELRKQLDVPVSVATVWRSLRALGLTLKKSPARS
jgi:transposase